jgi:hypothetical protein
LAHKIAAKAYTFCSPIRSRYVAPHVALYGGEPRAVREYRTDAAVPRFRDDKPIIVFEGKCVLWMATQWPLPARNGLDRRDASLCSVLLLIFAQNKTASRLSSVMAFGGAITGW